MVETYSSMGLWLCMLRVFCIVWRVLLYVSLRSRIITCNLGLMFMGSVVLFICSTSCVMHSAVSGVKRVHVILSRLK